MNGRRILTWLLAGAAAGPALAGDYLGNLTWPEAERRLAEADAVIVPFGAGAKEHGPHLPMNADAVVLDYLVERAVEQADVVAVPPVLHGWLPAFRDFPGTEIADPTVFQAYMQELAATLVRHGARRLVFLNTSIAVAGGLPISIVAREVRAQTGTPTLVVSWGDLESTELAALAEQREGGHADEIETSINLYLQPDKVHMDRAVADYGRPRDPDAAGYAPGVLSRDRDDPGYSPHGVYGDATLATAEKGRRALDLMTARWLDALQHFAETPPARPPAGL